jgi:hypothetical protein
MRAYRIILCGLGIAIVVCGPAGAQDGSGPLREPPINFPQMPTPADPWVGDGKVTGAPAPRIGLLGRLRHRLTDLTPTEMKLLSSPRSPMAAYGAMRPAATVSPATPTNGGLPTADPSVMRVATPRSAEPSRPGGSTGATARTGLQPPPPTPGEPRLRTLIPPPRSFSPGVGSRPDQPPSPYPASGTNAAGAPAPTGQPGARKIVIPPPPSPPIPRELQAVHTVEPKTGR